MNEFREALILYLARLRVEYEQLCGKERAAIDDATHHKGTIAESSWKPRHRVGCRIRAAVHMLEALS